MLASLRRLLKSILLLFCILRTTAQRAPLGNEGEAAVFSPNDDYYGRDELWALFRQQPQQHQRQHHERRAGNGNAEIVLASTNGRTIVPHQRNEFGATTRMAAGTTTDFSSFPLQIEEDEPDNNVIDLAIATPNDVELMADATSDGQRYRPWTIDYANKDGEHEQSNPKGRRYGRHGDPSSFQRGGKFKPPPWIWPWPWHATHKRANTKEQADKLNPVLIVDALKRLGFYFKDLKDNMHYAHNYKLTQDQLHLLNGDHPLHMLQVNSPDMDPQDVSDFLQTLRNYRPSEKIRSLVTLTPNGYQGSHLIDPNYMWIGLGK